VTTAAGGDYRPDIDGLRAVAVLSVLLYHVGFTSFSGGFVGVDVFFVISGFLITRLIVGEVARGTFSFANFYARRARRIFPALFFTLLACFCAAFVLFPPEHMRSFAGSLVYAVLSLSNVWLYRESGYFDADAIFKPLLHTWSLSVEEQFYLAWPLLLVWLCGRKHKAAAPALLVVLGISSLVLAQRALDDPAAAFYFPQYRVVEFAAGAILVWLGAFRPRSDLVVEALLLLGLALIAYSAFAFDTRTAFPGVHAMVPCMGAALVIFAGQARYLGRVLSNPLSVGIGLVSYSLYLVHWPLIVFYRYYRIVDLTPAERWMLVAVSIGAAVLMYRFVEKPFRRPARPLSAPAFGLACAMCSLAICLPAADAWGNGGWSWRFAAAYEAAFDPARDRAAIAAPAATAEPGVQPGVSETMRSQLAEAGTDEYAKGRARYIWHNMNELREPFTAARTRKVLVVGDSQAGDFVNILRETHLDDGIELRTLAVDSECQAIIPANEDVYRNVDASYRDRCRKEHEAFRGSPQLAAADVVILSANWKDWALPHVDNTVERVAAKGAKEIYIVGRKTQGMTPQMYVTRFGGIAGVERFAAKYRDAESLYINARIRDTKGAQYIDLMSIACPARDACPVFTPRGEIIFYDITHLTPAGARYFGERLVGRRSLEFLSARSP
jgi:peptidoglycan/LPS O-acetylase OafA/YrhL